MGKRNKQKGGAVLLLLPQSDETTLLQDGSRFIRNSKGRSGRLQLFFKLGVLKNFVNFTGKHLCCNLFLIKLQA